MVAVKALINHSPLDNKESLLLLSHASGLTKEKILANPEKPIKPSVYKKYRQLEKKRLSGWPIAYLTGHQEFYGYDFLVSPAVLIPRPETEMVVDTAISLFNESFYDQVIDIGCGSGAIIISLNRELKRLQPKLFNKINFYAVDISAPALKIAKKNVSINKAARSISLKNGDLLKPFLTELKKTDCRRILITANLPYLTPRQIGASPSIQKEPRLALDGGYDGLNLYRRLLKQAGQLEKTLSMILELDPAQDKKIIDLTTEILPGSTTKIILDLSGQKRFALITKKAPV